MSSRNNVKTDPVRNYQNSSQPTTESPTLYVCGPTDLLQSGRSSRENDLWEFMWAHKDESGLQMSRSARGIETYFLLDAEIDLVDLRHRLSTYRVPFLGKK